MRVQHTEFVRRFAGTVSAFLQMEFALTLGNLTTTTYSKFTEALPDPAHLTLFRLEPLAGLGIISLAPTLGLAITNRMLGGRGLSGSGARTLTEIETGLLEDFQRMIVEDWCRQWEGVQNPRALLVGHETNGRFLQTSPAGTNMLVVTLEATFGEAAKQALQIAMPYAALEACLKNVQAPNPGDPRPAQPPDLAAFARRRACAGISLPATADWRVADVTLRDVLALRAGDVLELPTAMLAQTRISLTGRALFVGTAGLRDGRIAVKLERHADDTQTGAITAEQFAPFLATE